MILSYDERWYHVRMRLNTLLLSVFHSTVPVQSVPSHHSSPPNPKTQPVTVNTLATQKGRQQIVYVHQADGDARGSPCISATIIINEIGFIPR